MNDLDKLFDGFKAGRLKYPQPRRETEDVFFGELVARIKAIEAYLAPLKELADRPLGRDALPPFVKPDPMAAARAAKAAKREEAAV